MKILVVNTLGLHLGYLGCYGNDWIATPNIDRLAAEGITFDQHILRTPDLATPAPSLNDWQPHARACLDRLHGGDGVIHLLGPTFAPPWDLSEDLLTAYSEDDEVKPWPDPVPGELADDDGVLRVQDTYAAAVTWFDALLGRVLEDLAARSGAEEMMVVLTSSAGYPLGEHGRLGWDRPWLHDEAVHVPLIIRCPGRRLAGLRIGAITQPDDLTNALAAWAKSGVDDLGGASGLPGLIRGDIVEVRPHALSTWSVGGRSETALRTPEWALLVPGERHAEDPPRTVQLYVKPDDRWEVNDIGDQELETVETLERTLRESFSPALDT